MRTTVDRLLNSWRVNYAAPLKRRSFALWKWWIAELVDLMPKRLRDYIAERNTRVFLLLFNKEVVIFQGTIEDMRQIGRCRLDESSNQAVALAEHAHDLVLLLPPDKILSKTITLPAATEENLREVLAFEMDYETPFRADRVYYDGVVTGRFAEHRTIDVNLVLTPRGYLDDLLASLSIIGFRPDIVSAKHASGAIHDANLLPPDRMPARPVRWSPLNKALGVAALVLLVVAIALPIEQKLRVIGSLEPRVAEAMEAAREGSRIRDDIERLTLSTQELIRRKAAERSTMELLDDLTRNVPDDTWIDRLDIDSDEIQMQGLSSAAASLIGLMETATEFENPQFRSPVTQLSNSSLESFHVSVQRAGTNSP